jgi:hypothetical protein
MSEKGIQKSMAGESWKASYLKNYSHCQFSESRKRQMRQLLLEESLHSTPSFSADSQSERTALPSVSLFPQRKPSLLSKVHRNGLGYVAAAAAFAGFVVISRPETQTRSPSSTSLDPAILRYARLLPADFDLEGDPSALPAVVSEVVGSSPGQQGNAYEMQLPDGLRRAYEPREGRFFTGPDGTLGVAIQLRAPRSGGARAKTLYMMPAERDVRDAALPNTLAKFASFDDGRMPARIQDPISGQALPAESAWRMGNVNYMVVEP